MKYRQYSYPIVNTSKYNKVCSSCGVLFQAKSKNKRLCDDCRSVSDELHNKKRVKKHRDNASKSVIGTGRLGSKALPFLDELDAIISEMYYLRLL